jgi:hypothetical protein
VMNLPSLLWSLSIQVETLLELYVNLVEPLENLFLYQQLDITRRSDWRWEVVS